ncbi:MAG: hypothetical protein J0M12_04555 [Deltaproteobacteria bacterium]|nr:hypothetical protein [Deltaproteobacteria bacterium]
MNALAPSSSIWQGIEGIGEVLLIEETTTQLPAQVDPELETLVIPLLEDHIAGCPSDWPRLAPSAVALKTLRDKSEFARFSREQHLTDLCPEVYSAENPRAFPCILKVTSSNASHGVALAYSQDEVNALLLRAPWSDVPSVIQEFVEGSLEYVCHCVCKSGRIVWHAAYAYEVGARTIRLPGLQTSPFRVTNRQLKEFERFLRPLSYDGPCNIDYKIRPNGRTAIFEINPRLGGSLMLPSNQGDLRAALRSIISTFLSRSALQQR